MTLFELAHYARCDTWFNYQDFYDYISSQSGFSKFAEIGVWKGHSVAYLAHRLRGKSGVEIVAVDTWDDRYLVRNKEYIADYKRQMGHIMEMYNYNLQAAGVRHIVTDVRERSHLAAKRFEDCYFDVVFIDADHRVENVIRDIIAWLPKVKSGGIISGHDYTRYRCSRCCSSGIRRSLSYDGNGGVVYLGQL